MLKNIKSNISKNYIHNIHKWTVRCLPLIILSLTLYSFANEHEKIIGDPYNNNSNITFNQIMEGPIMRDLFLQLQRRNLLEPVDSLMHSFIENNPEIKKLSLMLAEAFKGQFASYVINLELSHTFVPIEPLTQNSNSSLTKKYRRIQRVLGDIARDFGYSNEAIKNRLFYIANGNGEVNAFTVSPFQDNIVIVANEELIDKMSDLELRAVLGHELSHIRAGHVANGILLNMLMNMTLRYFSPQETMGEAMMDNGSHNHFAKYINNKGINNGAYLNISMRDIEAYIYHNREILVPKFINICKSMLDISPGYSKEAQFFKDLSSLQESKSSASIDIQKLKIIFELVGGIVSRAQETSSDRFASSQSHSENIATAMLKLAGLSAEANKEETRAILKSTIDRTNSIVSQLSPEELRLFNENSHPLKSLRILSIISFPRTPDIFFANPFMKLLLMENEITNKVKILHDYTQDEKSHLEAMKAEVKKNDTANAAGDHKDVKTGAQERIAQLESITQELKQELDKLRQSIVAKIISIDLQNETKEKFKNPDAPANPRFDNLLQFSSFNKLMIIQSWEETERKMSLIKADKEKLNSPDSNINFAQLNNKRQLLITNLNNFSFELISLLENQYQFLHKKNRDGFFMQRLQKLEVVNSVRLESVNANGKNNKNSAQGGLSAEQLSQLLDLNSSVSGKKGRSKIHPFKPLVTPKTFGVTAAPNCKDLFSSN